MDISKEQISIPAISAVVVVAVLTLFQGGYYSDSALIAGLVSLVAGIAIVLAFRGVRDNLSFPLYAVLLAGIGIFSLVGALFFGITSSALSDSLVWFAVAGFALLSMLIKNDQRSFLYCLLGWAGVATSIIALLMCSGIIPYLGAESDGRLQASFQYANTAALWFVVTFVFAVLSEDRRLRVAAFFPLLAVFLTQSMGTLAIFAIVILALLIYWQRNDQVGRMCAFFMLLICAVASTAASIVVGISEFPWCVVPAAAIGFVLLLALRRFFGLPLEKWFVSHASASIGLIVFSVVVMCGLLVVFFITGRLFSAWMDFVERIVQMSDAITVLGISPLVGLGPEGWEASFQYIQSAQYYATSIHNSFLQVAIDAGLVGLALFVALIVLGLRAAIKSLDTAALFGISIIVVHMLIDFDLQFCSIAMLLVLLLPKNSDPEQGGSLLVRVSFALVSVVVAIGCCVGLWSWQQRMEVSTLIESGETAIAEEKMSADPLLNNDMELRSALLLALCQLGDLDNAVALYRSWQDPTSDQGTMAAMALYEAGDQLGAEQVLLDQMDLKPHNVRLFEAAETLFEEHGLSEVSEQRYQEVRTKANQPVSGIGSLLQNQKTF